MIKRYQNNVFTNDGTCSVEKFSEKLEKAAEDLKLVRGLVVYTGFHGNSDGNFDKVFNNDEINSAGNIRIKFYNAVDTKILADVLPDVQIVEAVEKGSVIFTWCNSDTKVRKVMTGRTFTLVKEYPLD
jgi:hypothetical protein